MEQPFIYKYKPKSLNNFEINPKIIELLKTFIQIDNLNLLLVGPPGCGKTSLINCLIQEYYLSDYNSSNILTINALKEQGISYYRSEVKTFCQTMCSVPTKKKSIILDDIDNINEQSQQVFRNCMDKYNNNVNFIATCTNIQKVIDSFQSRIIILRIDILEKYYLKKLVSKICIKENIEIAEDASEFILSICDNSVRTLINYLEKFKLMEQKITYDIVIASCTNISFRDFDKFTNLCMNYSNLSEAILLIYSIYDRGYSVMDILDTYFLFIKTTDLLDETKKYSIIKLLCKYIMIFYNIHEDEIELALFTNNLIAILEN
jgi:DNA polymerase III delta prime subunit